MEPLEPTPEAERNTVAPEQVEAAVSVATRIADNIRRAVKVTDDVLEHVIVSLLAEGHILVEDYPGVGKTALARALARSVDCQFARVQCTADLLPADIVGTNVYNQREARFEFRPGPIFANIVIVDEINRASPKTQSGLLECMQERQVTVDATSHELARPFMVFATQNPVEYEGTYPLPEAQVDRFMVRVSLGYPNAEEEAGMLAGHEAHDRVLDLEAVADRAEVVEAVEAAHGVHASRALRDYIVALAAPHARRRAGRARRLAARRPDAAARRQGARARPGPRPRAARRRPGAGRDRAGPPAHARARGGGRRARNDRGRRDRGHAGSLSPMRSALGCAALGVLLLVVAGTFDAEPLYVTGSALALLGLGAAGWIGLGAWGAQIKRELGARSVLEEQPLEVRIRATRRPDPAAARLDRRAAAARAGPLPRRPAGRARARRGHLRPPRAPPAGPARARAARPVRARPARGHRPRHRRDPGAAARAAGPRHGGRRRRHARPRPRGADRRRRDRARRPARAPARLARLAHPLAGASPAATG